MELIEKEVQLIFLTEVIALENDVQLSPWSLKNFEDALTAKNLFKVFFIENKLIGYYVALFAAEECQLLNIAIHSDYQNNGYGHNHYFDNHYVCLLYTSPSPRD